MCIRDSAAPVSHIWFLRGAPSATGMLLGMTVKSLERIVYFASYVVISVDEKKREQFLKDLEAEAEAAQIAIKARYEKMAEEKDANTKELAAKQTQELEDTALDYNDRRAQLQSLAVRNLINETDYRDLPDEYADIVKVGMGAKAIKQLLDDICLLYTSPSPRDATLSRMPSSA